MSAFLICCTERIVKAIETEQFDVIRNIRKDSQAGFDRVVVGRVNPNLKTKSVGLLGPDEAQKVDFLCVTRI